MAEFIFLRRTQKELEVFGGDVFFDLDGKNIGKLSLEDQTVRVSSGRHTIKMYKSHEYATYIGFAETSIVISEDEQLMVRYATPMMVNQPGNIIVSAYDAQKRVELLNERDATIAHDYKRDEDRKKEQNEKYNTGIKIWIVFLIIDVIAFAVWEASIW